MPLVASKKIGAVLTTDLLIRKGYFPLELPPPFTTNNFADFLPALTDLRALNPKSSRSITFSIPKSHPARRLLSIPNPLHQALLSQSIADNWDSLSEIFNKSSISLSTPTVFPNGIRAVSRRADFDQWSIERFQRSSDSRFVLRTDFSRFYHTIYTHSLPWAIHGKQRAKSDRSSNLFGNLLDGRVRNTQDQQTIGLPVGPDTSFILAEVIGARIDQDLNDELGNLRGIRYVDDFHLYFDTRAEAEAGYAALNRVAKRYELEVNDRKTELFEGPDTGEPVWKTAIKAQNIRGKRAAQRSSLISFVSKAFELAKQYPSEGVLAYAVKKAAGIKFEQDNSDIYEAFLRASIVHDSSTMPLVTKILYERHQNSQLIQLFELERCLGKLALFHSQLRHQYEVCWILWLFRVLNMGIPLDAVSAVCEMDDPFVAVLLLDLESAGLAQKVANDKWEALMIPESLYTEHWILAYEAAYQQWLKAKRDYLLDDVFFGRLASNGVSFYGRPPDSGVNYVSLPMPYGT